MKIMKYVKLKSMYMMKKNIVVLLFFSVIISCSTLRKVKIDNIVDKSVIVEKSIKIVKSEFNENISKEMIGLYKRGRSNWKVILYGKEYYYIIEIKENGEINKVFRDFYKY